MNGFLGENAAVPFWDHHLGSDKAVFKSVYILNSVTVICFVERLFNFASSLMKSMPRACLIISPTLSCLCVIGFPKLLI